MNWPWFREQLHTHPFPDNMRSVMYVLDNMSGPGVLASVEYDEESRLCLMGVPSAFFYLAKYTLGELERGEDSEPPKDAVQRVMLQYSVFENYIPGWAASTRASGCSTSSASTGLGRSSSSATTRRTASCTAPTGTRGSASFLAASPGGP